MLNMDHKNLDFYQQNCLEGFSRSRFFIRNLDFESCITTVNVVQLTFYSVLFSVQIIAFSFVALKIVA